MAFGGGGGSGRVKSDINVTPLVDVVLVLLIIFLVAMPVVMRMINIDVPKKTDEPIENVVMPEQVTVEISKDGAVLLNGIAIDRPALAEKLTAQLEHKREKVVFVDFDESVKYGDAVAVMDLCKGAGAETVALKIKEADQPPAAPGGAQPAPGGAAPGTPAPSAPTAPTPPK
jgi:biopolymer transport protein TolR